MYEYPGHPCAQLPVCLTRRALCIRKNGWRFRISHMKKNIEKNVLMPANAKKRHVIVEQRLKQMAEDACHFEINRTEYRDKKIGVITSGIPYQYVREALPNASVLKLGLVHPLPRKLIEEFAAQVETLYIVEELEPVIEEQVRSWGIPVIGKEIFTVQGELQCKYAEKGNSA